MLCIYIYFTSDNYPQVITSERKTVNYNNEQRTKLNKC